MDCFAADREPVPFARNRTVPCYHKPVGNQETFRIHPSTLFQVRGINAIEGLMAAAAPSRSGRQ
jgi:hypothetical protein